MAADLLSSLGSALFSRLCSGSALFATARGSSTRASAASLGLRLCLARVALFGLTGSAHDFRLSLARVTNRLGPRLLSWAAGAARLSAWLGSATARLGLGWRCHVLVPARGFVTGDNVEIDTEIFLLEVALSLKEIGFPMGAHAPL